MNRTALSRPLLLAVALFTLAAGAAHAQQPNRRVVSLREALDLAARQGPDVAAARAQAAIAAAGVERAWTAWKPDVSATGTFDHTSAPAKFDLGGLANLLSQAIVGTPLNQAQLAKIGPPIDIIAANSRYGTLQVAQPLLTPQGLFAPGIAKHGAEAAARGADEAREQILLGVARAYFGLQGIDGLLGAARDAEKVALRREEDARAQINAGTAVELALLRAQTDTAQARVQIANLEGSRESLLPLLEAFTGEPIAPSPAGTPSGLPDAADEKVEPWENTFGVQSAKAAVQASAGAVRLDSYLWLPTVAAVAKGNYNSNAGFSGNTTSYDLILTASIPLYDRGTRYAAKHEDEARLQQAMANLAATRARARANWLGAKANLSSSQVALAQAVAQESLATRAQAQVDAAAKAGVATSLDLTDADNKRFLASSAAAQARTAVEVRRAELVAAEGRLFDAAAPPSAPTR